MSENMDVRQMMEAFGQREKQTKLERFRRLNPFTRPGQVLFAGSSLMEQFPINELLLDRGLTRTVYNRGVGGFTTAEMAEALEECVFALKPAHLFINIGTNDMNGPDYSLEGLLARYDGILTAIKERLPNVKLYLMAYYPLCEEVIAADPVMGGILRYRNNRTIAEANAAVEKLAARHGARFLDCNAAITDEHGGMRAGYTVEGMHMYADGYSRVLDLLLPVLEEIWAAEPEA